MSSLFGWIHLMVGERERDCLFDDFLCCVGIEYSVFCCLWYFCFVYAEDMDMCVCQSIEVFFCVVVHVNIFKNAMF